MRRAEIAEWVLSLVVAPEQASAMTGDFLEQRQTMGSGWFWWCVLRTFFSFCARTVLANAGGFGLLAIKGMGFLSLWQVPVVLLLIVLDLEVAPRHQGWLFTWLLFPSTAISQYLVGRMIAKRSSRRELSAWLALAILETSVNTAMILSGGFTLPAIELTFESLALYQIPAFAGAVLVRRRSLCREIGGRAR